MRSVTNPAHMLLFAMTAVLSFAQFICSCGFLYYNLHALNPGYYFSLVTCEPNDPLIIGNGNICSLQLYGWAVAMTVLSFLCFIICCITARLTYFLWGSAFLAHPGRDPICRVTFLSKKLVTMDYLNMLFYVNKMPILLEECLPVISLPVEIIMLNINKLVLLIKFREIC